MLLRAVGADGDKQIQAKTVLFDSWYGSWRNLKLFLALAYYGYQAYQGKRFAIPGLTSFLQDQNWI